MNLVEFVEMNKVENMDYALGSNVSKYLKSQKFDHQKLGHKKVSNYLETVPELRIVRNPPELRVYLTREFTNMEVVKDLKMLVDGAFNKKPFIERSELEMKLKKSKEFMKFKEMAPNVNLRYLSSFMPKLQDFNYQKVQMIENLEVGYARVVFEGLGEDTNIRTLKTILRNDGFKHGRINFSKGGAATVKITPPREAFRVAEFYNGRKHSDYGSMMPLEVYIFEQDLPNMDMSKMNMKNDNKMMMKNDNKMMMKNDNKMMKNNNKMMKNNNQMMKNDNKMMKNDNKMMKNNNKMMKNNNKMMKNDNKMMSNSKSNKLMMQTMNDKTDMQDEITIEPDFSRMLFMNKIPRSVTEEEFVEELRNQGFIVQNEIQINKRFIRPVILETEEQCFRALEDGVMVAGAEINVQRMRAPGEEMMNTNEKMTYTSTMSDEMKDLEKRAPRKSKKNMESQLAVVNVDHHEEGMMMQQHEEDHEEEPMMMMHHDMDAKEQEEHDEPVRFEKNERVEAFYDDAWNTAMVIDFADDDYDVLFEELHERILVPGNCLRKIVAQH